MCLVSGLGWVLLAVGGYTCARRRVQGQRAIAAKGAARAVAGTRRSRRRAADGRRPRAARGAACINTRAARAAALGTHCELVAQASRQDWEGALVLRDQYELGSPCTVLAAPVAPLAPPPPLSAVAGGAGLAAAARNAARPAGAGAAAHTCPLGGLGPQAADRRAPPADAVPAGHARHEHGAAGALLLTGAAPSQPGAGGAVGKLPGLLAAPGSSHVPLPGRQAQAPSWALYTDPRKHLGRLAGAAAPPGAANPAAGRASSTAAASRNVMRLAIISRYESRQVPDRSMPVWKRARTRGVGVQI